MLQSHDGAIHILPALPDVWPDGSVKGLVTRGGFVVDITWKNGKVKLIKVTSKLGGNCRLRVFDEIKTDSTFKFTKAKGQNPNPLFAVAEIKHPLISEKANLTQVQVRKVYEYDFFTRIGKTYVFKLL